METATFVVSLVSLAIVIAVLVLELRGKRGKLIAGEPLTTSFGAVLSSMGKATALPGASGNVVTNCRELLGFSIGETAASTAKVRLRDSGATGTILAVINLAASADKTVFFPDEGVEVPSGTLYYEKVSGALEGSVFTV